MTLIADPPVSEARRKSPARAGRRSTVREHVLILDVGSQYTQLIARRVREAGVFS